MHDFGLVDYTLIYRLHADYLRTINMIYIRVKNKNIHISYTTDKLHMIYVCNTQFQYDLLMEHTILIWFIYARYYLHMIYICNIQSTNGLHMQHTFFIWTWNRLTAIQVLVCSQFIENVHSKNWTPRGGWLPLAKGVVLSHHVCTLLTSTRPLVSWPDSNRSSSEDISLTPLERLTSLHGNMTPLPKITGEMNVNACHKSKMWYVRYIIYATYAWYVAYIKYAQHIVYVCDETHVEFYMLTMWLKCNLYVIYM